MVVTYGTTSPNRESFGEQKAGHHRVPTSPFAPPPPPVLSKRHIQRCHPHGILVYNPLIYIALGIMADARPKYSTQLPFHYLRCVLRLLPNGSSRPRDPHFPSLPLLRLPPPLRWPLSFTCPLPSSIPRLPLTGGGKGGRGEGRKCGGEKVWRGTRFTRRRPIYPRDMTAPQVGFSIFRSLGGDN